MRPAIAFAHFPPTMLSRTLVLSTANAASGLRGLVVSSCTQITANDVIPGLAIVLLDSHFMTLLNWKPNRPMEDLICVFCCVCRCGRYAGHGMFDRLRNLTCSVFLPSSGNRVASVKA